MTALSLARRSPRVVLVGLLTTAASACNRTSEVRYRVAVEVNDNGLSRVGSSVWRFRLTQGVFGGMDGRLKGEAVAVDLRERGTLFALMVGRSPSGRPASSGDMAMLPEQLFGDVGRAIRAEPRRHMNRVADLAELSRNYGATRELNCDGRSERILCPFMVTFKDPRDPKSIAVVDPLDLAATFGEGVSLKRVTVEITRDPVTTGLEAKLPSFGPETGFGEWYSNLPFHDPRKLSKSEFIWEG